MESVRLIEAQYWRDKEFRDRAMKFYEALHAWLDVPEDKLRKKLMPWGIGGFMANARDFYREPGFEKLSIVFLPAAENEATRASLAWSSSGWPVLKVNALLGPSDPKHLADRTTRETVVHEVIHLFDRQREKGKTTGSSEVHKTKGTAAYYNHPREWNAYWQAGANAAESMAKSVPPEAFDYYFGNGTLARFMSNARLHFWDLAFVDNMDKETSRKFDKRLADLWVSVIEPIAKVKLRKSRSMHEDEQQRMVRAGAVDDDHRLPNVHRIIPAERMKNVPYSGQSKVVIYRAIDKEDPSRVIRPGDWVALSKRYTREHMRPGGRILEREVLAYDVSWAGTDENEWFYAPMRKQVAR